MGGGQGLPAGRRAGLGFASPLRPAAQPGRGRLEAGGSFGRLPRSGTTGQRVDGNDFGGGRDRTGGGDLEGQICPDAAQYRSSAGGAIQFAHAGAGSFAGQSSVYENSDGNRDGVYGYPCRRGENHRAILKGQCGGSYAKSVWPTVRRSSQLRSS